MIEVLTNLTRLIATHHGINNKARLAKIVLDEFDLTKDRSVYYRDEFAIRFSKSNGKSFGNTVASLSRLQKYDDRPFIVCIVTPAHNYCILANTTCLKKISHSSQNLRINNIRGSFNGSDIVTDFNGIQNDATNLLQLYAIHESIGFSGNLARLVEATNNITPTGEKFEVGQRELASILDAPNRAVNFVSSSDYVTLKEELDARVEKFKSEILIAALIENVNVRGRIIEYLIAGEDDILRQELIVALQDQLESLPQFKTDNKLGDYSRTFDSFNTETDVKTKVMILSSNPKAYNLDKMLEFLSQDQSVFMFYFVGINPGKIVNSVLASIFQKNLLRSTILLRHWAGRNSRGVSQFEGKTINELILSHNSTIDVQTAISFLKEVVAL